MIALPNRLKIAALSILACLAISAQAISAENTITVTGKVTLPDGKPAAGASVTALYPSATPTTAAQTVTSADGVYSLQVPPDEYAISATKDTLTGLTWFAPTRTSDVTLSKGCMLMGMVIDKTTGQLVSDAKVTLNRIQAVRVTVDGTFCAIIPADQPTDISVTKDGFARCWTRFNPNNQDVAAIKFETKPEGILTGTVTDEQGNPIVGASVGYTQTDAQGKYLITGLDPDETSNFTAMANGFQVSNEEHITFQSDTRQATRNFVLRRLDKRTITGRVTHPDGSPVKGASLLCAKGSGYLDQYSATTDDNGNYTIQGVVSGKNALLARAPGCAPTFAAVPEKADATIDMVLPPGHTLEGRVINTEGKPVVGEGITINADCQPLNDIFIGTGPMHYRSLIRRIATDKDGYFKVSDMPAGKVYIETFFEGYARLDDMPLPVDTKDNIITLKTPGQFTGRVVNDADGKPITTFAVSYTDGMVPSIFNSPDGTFTISSSFQTPGERVDVTVNATGFRQCAIMGIDVASKSQPGQKPTEFRLQPSQPFTGRVTDTAGKPIEGVQITLIDAAKFGFTHEWTYVTKPSLLTRITARTDSDGRFATESMPFARATIAILRDGYGRKMIQGHSLSKPLEISLDAGATIIADATDASGNVPKDTYASVRCTSNQEDMHLFYPDAQGKITVPNLSPGVYVASLICDSATKSIQKIELKAGQVYTVDWNRQLPVTVKGTFTCKGQPFAHAKLMAHSLDGEIAAVGETDDNGNYSLSIYEPGRYSVLCYKGEWMASDHVESRLLLDLKDGINQADGVIPAASISGTLIDKATGKPLADTGITLYNWRTEPALRLPSYHFAMVNPFWFPEHSVRTDSEGRFSITNLAAGQRMLTASVVAGDSTNSNLPGQKIQLEPDETKTGLVVQVDTATGSASVMITSPSGTPVIDDIGFILSCRSDYGLSYRPESEPRNGSDSYKLKKAPNGGALFEGLPAGHYKLFVPATVAGPQRQQLLAATAEFDITPGATTNVKVTLKQGPAIVFRLTPAALDKFGTAIQLGYKLTKADSGQTVIEDSYAPNWGGIAYFGDRDFGRPTPAQSPAVIPLEPGQYSLEAVLRYDGNNMAVDDTRADLWSIKTKVNLQPGKDFIIDIDTP